MRFITHFISFFLFLFTFACTSNQSKEVKYIAYIGRYTDPKEPTVDKSKFDKLHELALTKYLTELNQNYPNTTILLKTFDCKRDGKISDSIYQQIEKDTSIIAVIDNTWGEHLSQCVQTIKRTKIPVIAMNADKNNLDFGPRILFTGNNDLLPLDLFSFISKISKNTEINFISEQDYPLHDVFLTIFKNQGITIKEQIVMNGKNANSQDSIKFYQQIDAVFQNPIHQKRLTVLNIHSTIGNQLIPYLDKNFHHLQLIGHSYVVNIQNLKQFGRNNNNDFIFISTPTDAISKRLVTDIDEMKIGNEALFENPNHAMFVERCLKAVTIFKHFLVKNPQSNINRIQVGDFIEGLKNTSFTDNNYVFEVDSTNSLVPELYFTEYHKGKLNSYPLQLNLERNVIPNLFFGIEIVDIYNIDVNTNSFTSDFYYWIKMDSTNRDVEKYIVFQNMKQNESSKELVFEKIDGKNLYKLYKVSGLFYVNYNLDNFPFDEQELYITAEIINPSTTLKVSFDQKSLEVDSTMIDKFKITEWKKNRFYVTVENTISQGLHGDPDIDEHRWSSFKNISFRLQVKRKILSPLLEIILPLIMIGIVSISLLMLRDISFENLGEVSIGVFITIVAFSISYSDSTPKTDSLTRADYLFWLTFMAVLSSFMIVIVMNSIYKHDIVITKNLRKVGVSIGIAYIIGVFIALLY